MIIGAVVLILGLAHQQPVPQPFPRPGQPRPTQPATEPVPQQPPPSQPAEPAAPAPSTTPAEPQPSGVPNATTLGLPVYPAATYLATYDAGQGQRYYLFGTNASFGEIVAYYRAYLKARGDQVFDAPPTHIFEVGRFREESMAYPPGITVKDYTWNGSEGYLHVKAGVAPQRYKTIIQVVPAPASTGR